MSAFWPQVLQQEIEKQACVLVTVVSVRGSAPRAAGSRMIVTPDHLAGSIGGGNLEFEATTTARELLSVESKPAQQQVSYGLGPRLNQCCGGWVELSFEVLGPEPADWLNELLATGNAPADCWLLSALDGGPNERWVLHPGSRSTSPLPVELMSSMNEQDRPHDPAWSVMVCDGKRFILEQVVADALPLVVFGAGHVGTEVIEAAKNLPFQVRWIDSREQMVPGAIPDNTTFIHSEDPVGELAGIRKPALFLVMTHSHELDEDICFRILSEQEFLFLGLIGSETKRARFVQRLKQRGIEPDLLERLVCPVGLSGISGKRPATIAVSIMAQLLMEQVPEHWR